MPDLHLAFSHVRFNAANTAYSLHSIGCFITTGSFLVDSHPLSICIYAPKFEEDEGGAIYIAFGSFVQLRSSITLFLPARYLDNYLSQDLKIWYAFRLRRRLPDLFLKKKKKKKKRIGLIFVRDLVRLNV